MTVQRVVKEHVVEDVTYTVTLTEKEAEELHRVRAKHMSPVRSSLWAALAGLPVPAEDSDPSPPRSRHPAFHFADLGFSDVAKQVVDSPRYAQSPIVAKRKGWKVQYSTAKRPNDWWDLRFTKSMSRNKAYKLMRERKLKMTRTCKTLGWGLGQYRVVSDDTPSRIDTSDRGHYRVQYFNKLVHIEPKGWYDCRNGVGYSTSGNRFKTVEEAQAAIHTHGNPRSTYRVKWYPGAA